MESIVRDLRFALRSLLKRPALFTVATLSLALGISANTTIFAAIDAYLIRPLPYPDADRLLQMWTTNASRGWRRASTSFPDFLDFRTASRTASIAAFTGGSFNMSGRDRPERLNGTRATSNFFSVVGVAPLVGRTFRAEEERPGNDGVAVLSYAFWKRRFASDRAIVGQTLNLDGSQYTVIGIMPEDFKYPSLSTDLWTPLAHTGKEARTSRYLVSIARVRSGSSVDAAQAELRAIAARLAKTYPEDAGNGINAVPFMDAIYGEEFHRGATISMVAVVFVLLIACANVANLLLARATGRARELALRTAIGASRWRLVRQLLTESVVLAVCGGVLGTVLSIWGVRAFVAIIPPDFTRTEMIALNGRALAFTLAISIACGVLFGLAPAIQSTRSNINADLRDGGRGGTMGLRRNRLGAALVIAEISLALVLLISAGLLIKGSVQLQRVDLGFESAGVLTARVSLPKSQYADSEKVTLFHAALLERLRGLGGVQAVGATSDLPIEGSSGTPYHIDGEPTPEAGKEPISGYKAVTPGYLSAMRISLAAGRDFTDQDRAGSPLVVLVSEAFVRRHWPNGSALGKRLVMGTLGPREIVGVVRDTRDYGPGEEPPALIYVPALQRAQPNLAYTVRSTLPPNVLAAAVRGAVAKVDPTMPLYSVQSMSEVVARRLQEDSIMPRLLSVFGAVALVLAIMGVYGVMSYSVSQRTQEMGVRMALGAQGADILSLVLRQGGLLAFTGVGLGLLLAAATTRSLATFLLGVSAYDPGIFAGVTIALALAALVASFVPARRALRVDPLIALRAD